MLPESPTDQQKAAPKPVNWRVHIAQTRPADATSGVCADLTLADHLGRGPHFGGGFRAWRLRFGWFPSTKIRLLTDG